MIDITPPPIADDGPDTLQPVETTRDAVFEGRIVVLQSRAGYRFSIDAILLAHRVARLAPRRGLEVGGGCGVISLCVSRLSPGYSGVAVEVQTSLVHVACLNVLQNDLADRLEIIHGDIREVAPKMRPALFDVVFMNPPYFHPSRGHVNPNSERAAARHQIHGNIAELITAARALLEPRGTLELVYPTTSSFEVIAALEAVGLRALQIRYVFSDITQDSKLCLISARQAGHPSLRIDPPLVLYDAPEVYTREVREMLAGGQF